MASKLPFKIFDIQKKLTSWSIRLNKTIKHKVLSKSRNVVFLTSQQNPKPQQFESKLTSSLKKTWEIFRVNTDIEVGQKYKQIENSLSGRQYDAIIVIPESNRQIQGFSNISDQGFVTNLETYNKTLMKNVLAYRLAHKFLATSGVIIFSQSQSDFAKAENKNGQLLVEQSALKNILDAQLSYLAVTVGDRDYTDLNSWSVVGLSEEHINGQNEDYVVKMYSDWANGSNLPMPGSFAFFKMKQEGKKNRFVQYL